MSNKLDISKSLLLEFFWKYWEPSFENHIGIMIQFILWSEWLLLNSLFNGVVLFHINGRNLILMYYVAVTSGIWHSSPKCQSRFFLFKLKLKDLSKGSGNHVLFKPSFPLWLKLAIKEKHFISIPWKWNQNIIQNLFISQGLYFFGGFFGVHFGGFLFVFVLLWVSLFVFVCLISISSLWTKLKLTKQAKHLTCSVSRSIGVLSEWSYNTGN